MEVQSRVDKDISWYNLMYGKVYTRPMMINNSDALTHEKGWVLSNNAFLGLSVALIPPHSVPDVLKPCALTQSWVLISKNNNYTRTAGDHGP